MISLASLLDCNRMATAPSFLPTLSISSPLVVRHARSPFIARAHFGNGDEAWKSMNSIVDSNMYALRERINQVKVRERLKRCGEGSHDQGWWYADPGYDVDQLQRSARVSEFVKIAGMAAGSFGLSIASGTVLLCLFSLLIHMNN